MAEAEQQENSVFILTSKNTMNTIFKKFIERVFSLQYTLDYLAENFNHHMM